MTRVPHFEPVSPTVLGVRLAVWIDSLSTGRLRVGIDGDAAVGAVDLADLAAASLTDLNRPTARVSTRWWWRPASLRLEHGRQDLASRLTGWVDTGSLRREVIEPLGAGGSGRYLSRLRDPLTDRALRETYRQTPENTVLVLDGPMLLTHELPLDAVVRLRVSSGRLQRALPPDRQWELAAFQAYAGQQDDRGAGAPAQVVVSYDHPATPAVMWVRAQC